MSYHNNRDGFYRMLLSIAVMFVITNIAGLFVKFGYPAWGFGVLIIGGVIVILSIVFYEDSRSLQTVFRWVQRQFATQNKLRGDPAPDNRCRYQIFLRGSGVLEQYRETLTSLARDIQQSNPEKATVYHRLADAINITEPDETIQREIPLLS